MARGSQILLAALPPFWTIHRSSTGVSFHTSVFLTFSFLRHTARSMNHPFSCRQLPSLAFFQPFSIPAFILSFLPVPFLNLSISRPTLFFSFLTILLHPTSYSFLFSSPISFPLTSSPSLLPWPIFLFLSIYRSSLPFPSISLALLPPSLPFLPSLRHLPSRYLPPTPPNPNGPAPSSRVERKQQVWQAGASRRYTPPSKTQGDGRCSKERTFIDFFHFGWWHFFNFIRLDCCMSFTKLSIDIEIIFVLSFSLLIIYLFHYSPF